MSEKQRAEKVQEEINLLVEQARVLLQEKMQGALLALEEVKRLLSEAETLAKTYNRGEAQTLLLYEEFSFYHDRDLPAALQNAKITAGPTTLRPGVKVRLGQTVNFKDYPRSSVVVLLQEDVEYLQRQSPSYAVIVD